MKFTKKTGDANEGWSFSVLLRLDVRRLFAGIYWSLDNNIEFLKSRPLKDFMAHSMGHQEAYRLWYAHTMSRLSVRTFVLALHIPLVGIHFEISRFRIRTPVDVGYSAFRPSRAINLE